MVGTHAMQTSIEPAGQRLVEWLADDAARGDLLTHPRRLDRSADARLPIDGIGRSGWSERANSLDRLGVGAAAEELDDLIDELEAQAIDVRFARFDRTVAEILELCEVELGDRVHNRLSDAIALPRRRQRRSAAATISTRIRSTSWAMPRSSQPDRNAHRVPRERPRTRVGQPGFEATICIGATTPAATAVRRLANISAKWAPMRCDRFTGGGAAAARCSASATVGR